MSDSILRSNLLIAGNAYDNAEDRMDAFLNIEMWPDTTVALLTSFEKAYGQPSTGSLNQRRGRVLASARATGGLSLAYIEGIANVFAAGEYLVFITEGQGSGGFILGEDPTPVGIGTPLPATLADDVDPNKVWNFTVTVNGAPFDPQPELEKLILKLKPAWAKEHFVYVP